MIKYFKEKEKLIFWMILIVGIAVRIFQLGIMPVGVTSDEAFSAYESYSMLKYGHDSFGYHNPVYLVTWGSGMNALQSYLMMPFIAIFGMHLWVVRLPQAIVACISIPILYKTVKMMFSKKVALLSMFLLAISPWHIMLARWGLESNLAPGFLLFGFYFFLKGCENNKYFLFSALFYGLSLYCYSTLWVFVPITLSLQGIWAIKNKYTNFNKYIVMAIFILSVLALPLILFVMVNTGIIKEIKTDWISIPELVAMRNDSFSLTHILDNFQNFCKRFILQYDWIDKTSIKPFGLFYQFSMPFAFIGLFSFIKSIIKKDTQKYQIFILFNFVVSIFICLIVHVNIIRMNVIHMWTLLLITLGLCYIFERYKKTVMPLLFLYCFSFIAFTTYYFTTYRSHTLAGLEEAINYSKEQEGTIFIEDGINYPKIMYYSQISPNEYRNTVEYSNYPNEFLAATSFGRYRTYIKEINDQSVGTYIFKKEDVKVEQYKKEQLCEFDDYLCITIN